MTFRPFGTAEYSVEEWALSEGSIEKNLYIYIASTNVLLFW